MWYAKKLDQLSLLINKHSFDVIFLAETFLDSDIPGPTLYINGYSFLRRDRLSFGGGLIVYYRSSLVVQLIADPTPGTGAIELLLVQLIQPCSKPLNLLGVTDLHHPLLKILVNFIPL